MKRLSFSGILVMVLTFSCFVRSALATNAPKLEVYKVGVHFGLGANQDADLTAMHKELLSRLGKSLKVKFLFESYSSQKDMDKAILEKKLDIVQAPVGGLRPLLMSLENGYQPFGQLSIAGKDQEKLCLYRKKSSQKFDLKKLKGKKAVISPDPIIYYVLREMVQDAPEDFFEELKAVNSSFSGFFALTLGEGDVAISNQTVFNSLKVINPGPVKNLEEVQCAKIKLPMAMALTHKKVPGSLKKSLMKIVTDPEHHPAFKPFLPLIKQFKLKAIPVQPKDFSQLLDLEKKAKKKGWDKEFKRWEKKAK